MTETVTVIEAKNPNPWEHGITYYDMIFDRNGQRFACSWGTKGGEPQPGEEVTGEFSQKSDGSWKFSKGSKDKPDGGAPRSSEASTSNTSKPASPGGETNWEVRNAEIRRQHSQEMALRFLDVQELEYEQAQLEQRALLDGPVRTLIDWFDADAVAAGQRTSQGQMPSTSRSDSPAAPEQSSAIDFTGARKEEPNQDLDRDHIMQLLSSAGLFYAGAQEKVADFIMGPLLLEGRSDAALSALQDHERQANALTQLKTSTEEWTGQPLDEGGPKGLDDDIPF